MIKYTNKKDKYTAEETDYSSGKPITKYFDLYCDICGRKYGKIPVDDLTKEEGFPKDGDYCWECQESMRAQGFVGKNKCILFLKKDYPKPSKGFK